MADPIRVLLAEDLPTDAELAQREIRKALPGCVFEMVQTRADYLAALRDFRPDLIVSDYRMPQFDGLTALNLALAHMPLAPVIIWTGSLNEDVAVECMKAGATNYVIKEHIKRLGPAVLHAMEERHVRLQRWQAEDALRRYTHRLEMLHAIDRGILAAHSPHEIAVTALQHLYELIGCAYAGVDLLDVETSQLIVLAAISDRPGALREGMQVYLPPAMTLLAREQDVFVADDLREAPLPEPIKQLLDNDGYRSLMVVPLKVEERLFGSLNLAARDTGFFTLDLAETVREVAVQLAIALRQNQLYEQVQRHAANLEQRVADRTRELAQANERLQELDQLKSKFVSDVSHELRTPIANVKIYLELLDRGKPEKRASYLATCREQANRMAQLIDDILDLSRLERDKVALIFEPVDLNAVLERVVIALLLRAEAAGLKLIFEPEDGLPPVQGEINQLLQVATNLIENAINYTATGEVRITSRISTPDVCFEVHDTGLGIDPEDLPHLFERFYRGKRASQSGVRGTGLGLSIVRDIVELHGGHLEVESAVKVGSTFRVYLPIAPAA